MVYCAPFHMQVMMVYAKQLLMHYKELFEDMDEYMQTLSPESTNNSCFMAQVRHWRKDWRSLCDATVIDQVPRGQESSAPSS